MKVYYKIAAVMFMMLLCLSCNNKGATETGSTVDYYAAVQEVAPNFEASESSGSLNKNMKAVVGTWESGNKLYEIYQIFRDFDNATDQGVRDTSNIHKTMWEANNFYTNTKTACDPITKQIITSPFNFGNVDEEYNCAINKDVDDGYDFGGAIREVDIAGNDVIQGSQSTTSVEIELSASYGLFGFIWVDAIAEDPVLQSLDLESSIEGLTYNHLEYGVLQESLDEVTRDLSIDLAVWVDYDGDDDYCYRNSIRGNTETHEFTVRAMKGSLAAGATKISIVGKGISEGVGNYFLFKAIGDDDVATYFCIKATDGESELKLMDLNGSAAVDVNCAVYQADVDALGPFELTDLLCASSDLNPGGTGIAAEGSIYLEFQ